MLGWLSDQRGAVMPFTVLMTLLMLAAAGLAVDWGRYLLVREAVLTATEAAALAGSGEGKRMVSFDAWWEQGERVPRTVCGEDGCKTKWVCVDYNVRGPRHFRGLEAELLDNPSAGGYWENQIMGDCILRKWIEQATLDRWAEFPPDTASAAQAAFRANLSGASRAAASVRPPEVTVHQRGDPARPLPGYPSVVVRVRAEVPAVLARVLGIGSFRLERCVQAEVRGYHETRDLCRRGGS